MPVVHYVKRGRDVRKKGVLARSQNTTLLELNRGCVELNWHSQFSPFTPLYYHKYNSSSLV